MVSQTDMQAQLDKLTKTVGKVAEQTKGLRGEVDIEVDTPATLSGGQLPSAPPLVGPSQGNQ